MEHAFNILDNENTSSPSSLSRILAAVIFIQHECFQKAEARRRVSNYPPTNSMSVEQGTLPMMCCTAMEKRIVI